MKKILLIEPPGDFIRLDRCMQSIDSWGGVYRFPLNLSRIAAHLINLGKIVKFIDLQADNDANLKETLLEFKPELCILSCGFPSMLHDSNTAKEIKYILPSTHVSTFGVPPTLLENDFFNKATWGFDIHFDSIVYGGEPSFGYEELLKVSGTKPKKKYYGGLQKFSTLDTKISRKIFPHSLYKSPFTGQNATYIEGSFGCPYTCSFCVVPVLYDRKFSKRTPEDIVEEFKFAIEYNNVQQITLWDEGTTFQKSFINELCDRLIELRKGANPKFKNFIWTTRSTTALIDEKIVNKLALSGLSGITLGIESFDQNILSNIGKSISISSNLKAIELLSKYNIISIGHIILGHLHETKKTIERTIQAAIESKLSFAQFYCAVPYPNTTLHKSALRHNLIRVKDLTLYELSNPIMDTLGGLTYQDIGNYRKSATRNFWSEARWSNLNQLINTKNKIKSQKFTSWGLKE